MKSEHIALNIIDSNEVEKFYHNILGMIEVRKYELDNNLAKRFFNINKDTSVHLMRKDDFVLELFVNENVTNHGFNHICIKVENREDIVSKAKDNSYKCVRREREHFDQIFISDKSGNIFEIKDVD